MTIARSFSIAALALSVALLASALPAAGCASDDPSNATGAPDASEGGRPEDGAAPGDAGSGDEDDAATAGDAGRDANCPAEVVVTEPGETCIGFGKRPDPCDVACGLPAYGYVCFEGSPPGFAGCVQVTASAFGETYCCPENRCVAQPDQDAMCDGVSGKPHRYQCPPAEGGGHVAPPDGCAEHESGGTDLEKFYCCP